MSPRRPSAPVDPLFPERWSPRAFDPRPIPRETLLSLFEAARWAPSARNEQPWLFLYADTAESLALFRPLLVDANRAWADAAPALAFALARRHFARNGAPNVTSAFDTGAAWMSLALQARLLGLYTHAMGGFHAEKAYEVLGVPRDTHEILAAIAVGRLGDPATLSAENRAIEAPNDRKPLVEVAIAGRFPGRQEAP